jgi:CrcB protein
MSRIFFLIGFGGFLGSVCRYYSQQFIARFSTSFPYGTLAVNIAGCFLVGLVFGFAAKGNVLSPEWRMFLATGFCGGFTTFSTFSYESTQLINNGEYFYLALYIGASVIVGILATLGGIAFTRLI